MLDIHDLERRWRSHKIKSYIPYGVIIVSLGIIVVLIFTIYNSKVVTKNISKQPQQKQNIVAIEHIDNNTTKPAEVVKLEKKTLKEKVVVEKIIEEKIIKDIKVAKPYNQEKVTLSPSLDFISEMKHRAVSYYDSDTASSYTKDEVMQKPEPSIVEEPLKIEKQITKKSTISIERQNTQEDISHVIKRFKKNNNPALSLFVAKKYYELGEYDKSYNYALITNGINDNIDASWIIFAKSLVKLNQKDEAMKILKKYFEHSHSNQAKLLLEEIRTRKFK